MIEVADFNFGETQPLDMEYKTFRQRLVESFKETLGGLGPLHSRDSEGQANPNSNESNLRYGVMM